MLSLFKINRENVKKSIKKTSTIAALIKSNPINPIPNPQLNLELYKIHENLKQIIAFVDTEIGGKKGKIVFEKLKNYLNKDNVFNLRECDAKIMLEANKNKKDIRILVCGDDNTVVRLMTIIDEINFQSKPAFGILPLGKENNIAKTFGWGNGYKNEQIKSYINNLIKNDIVKLDRWSIKTTPLPNYNKKTKKRNETDKLPIHIMNKYFNIGKPFKKSYNKSSVIQFFKNDLKNIEELEYDGKNYTNEMR